jgi:hypothetical protein
LHRDRYRWLRRGQRWLFAALSACSSRLGSPSADPNDLADQCQRSRQMVRRAPPGHAPWPGHESPSCANRRYGRQPVGRHGRVCRTEPGSVPA